MVKLKSLGLIKAGDNDAMKQMKSLGKTGSRKIWSFYPKLVTSPTGYKNKRFERGLTARSLSYKNNKFW